MTEPKSIADRDLIVDRDILRASLLLRDLPSPRHRAFAQFISEWSEDDFWALMRKVELREAAAADATKVETIPRLTVIK